MVDTTLRQLCNTHKRELEASYKSMIPRLKDDNIKTFKQWRNPVNGNKEYR